MDILNRQPASPYEAQWPVNRHLVEASSRLLLYETIARLADNLSNSHLTAPFDTLLLFSVNQWLNIQYRHSRPAPLAQYNLLTLSPYIGGARGTYGLREPYWLAP